MIDQFNDCCNIIKENRQIIFSGYISGLLKNIEYFLVFSNTHSQQDPYQRNSLGHNSISYIAYPIISKQVIRNIFISYFTDDINTSDITFTINLYVIQNPTLITSVPSKKSITFTLKVNNFFGNKLQHINMNIPATSYIAISITPNIDTSTIDQIIEIVLS